MLNNWYKKIHKLEKLRITTAKELLIKASNTNNPEKKKEYINKVILGTLYVPYNFVKSLKVELLNNPSYDTDDIINTVNELWIEQIYSGVLLEVDEYNKIFTRSFYKKIIKSLIEEKYSVSENFRIRKEWMPSIIKEYNTIRKDGTMTSKEFKFFVFERKNNTEGFKALYKMILTNENNVYKFQELLENIYLSIKNNNSYSERKLFLLIDLLIDNGIRNKDNKYCEYQENVEDDYINKVFKKEFIENIFKYSSIPEKTKEVIKYRYGFLSDEPKSLKETAELTGMEYKNTERREVDGLRSIRRILSSKKLCNYLYSYIGKYY